MSQPLNKVFPILDWGRQYNAATFSQDFVAAIIVSIMLIPQSLAYASLAGLPPQYGLYASILPLIVYAVFGSSRTLAVGPVAIVSLMTAAAVGTIAEPGSAEYIQAAIVLAFLSSLILILMGLFKLGFIANFLSHPVVIGFISASGIIITASQIKHLIGVEASGHTLVDIIPSLLATLSGVNIATSIVGFSSLLFLFFVRYRLATVLGSLGFKPSTVKMLTRSGPVFAVILCIVIVAAMELDQAGVKVLGDVPSQLPSIGLPSFDLDIWLQLFGSAVLISLIGFVESISVAKTFAARRRQSINPNQELIGLGTANLSAGISSGFPVTGGLARSAVNYDAGAQTPAAGAFTAVGIALATLYLTPYLYYLPQAVLAATIIVAVLSLIDIKGMRRVWRYSKSDFSAMLVTLIATLIFGVEVGVVAGVILSLVLLIYNTSSPHFAIVGQVPGTHHFRNIERHDVKTFDQIVTIRIDESLYFANSRFLEDTIYKTVNAQPDLKHLIVMCTAVYHIDSSALETLEAINHRLDELGITLHLSEVKGPVMDQLGKTRFINQLSGNIYLEQYQAIQELVPLTDGERYAS